MERLLTRIIFAMPKKQPRTPLLFQPNKRACKGTVMGQIAHTDIIQTTHGNTMGEDTELLIANEIMTT